LATVIVNGGVGIITALMKATGQTEPVQIGWGTGAGTSAKTDTALFSEVATDLVATTGTRTAGTSSRVTGVNTNDTYRVTGTRTAVTNSGTVTNAGLFDNNTIGSGTLFLKTDFAGIGLNGANGDSIAFTLDTKFAN